MDLHVRVPDNEYKAFKNKVGEGEISRVMRSFILNYISGDNDDGDMVIVKKELEIVESKKIELDEQYAKLRDRVQSYNESKKLKELEAMQKEKRRKDSADRAQLAFMRDNLWRVIK